MPRAINSVLNQEYRDLEIIVVDDAGTDNTEEVVAAIGDDRVRYVRHEENKRVAAARNTGVRAARGTFIGFLDSDDEWLPSKLVKQLAALDDEEVDIVYAGWEWVDASTGAVQHSRIPNVAGRYGDRPRWSLNLTHDFLVRAYVLRDEPYREELLNYMEYDILLRYSARYRAAYVPEPLLRCYSHSGSRLSDSNAQLRVDELEYIFEQHGHLIRKDSAGAHRLNRVLGDLYLRHLHEPSRARGPLFRAAVAMPTDFKVWGLAALSLLPAGVAKRF